jgi:CO/xanthine dehydrogenase FAD-binding subunit
MVIAICSFALALHPAERRVGTGIGSAGPVPLRAGSAEEFLAGHLGETNAWDSRTALDDAAVDEFARLVAASARPIDDVRGSADYRRHALRVLARRSLAWCWDEYREMTS